jgi:hypothetical protein
MHVQQEPCRLFRQAVAQQFFDQVIYQPDAVGLLSDEHLMVDGTLTEATASLKRFRPKDRPPADEPPDASGNRKANSRGEKRSTSLTRVRLSQKHAWAKRTPLASPTERKATTGSPPRESNSTLRHVACS